MHYHYVEDSSGDVVELVPFCSDSCHERWCRQNSEPYGGWNGCHESEVPEYCGRCGVLCNALPCGCCADIAGIIAPLGRCEHGGPLDLDTACGYDADGTPVPLPVMLTDRDLDRVLELRRSGRLLGTFGRPAGMPADRNAPFPGLRARGSAEAARLLAGAPHVPGGGFWRTFWNTGGW